MTEELRSHLLSTDPYTLWYEAMSDYNKIRDPDYLQGIMDLGVDVSWVDDRGNTLLHMAVKDGAIDSIQFLTKSGIDINTKNNTGTVALHTAVIHKDYDACQTLLSLGADPNQLDHTDLSPLYYAVSNENIDISRLLLDHNASMKTPLHRCSVVDLCAANGSIEALELLMEYGLDLRMHLSSELLAKRIREIARGNYHYEFLEFLDTFTAITTKSSEM